eukprot:6409116-Heterocapsa_arctica.AAC.1
MAPPVPPTPRTVLSLCVGVQSLRMSVRSRECQSEFEDVSQKSKSQSEVEMSISIRECQAEIENVSHSTGS